MEILQIRSARSNIDLKSRRSADNNRITILTGPNGCGKTEILIILANAFRSKKLLPRDQYVQWHRANRPFDTLVRHDGLHEYPERIITQTFSPFSRFPAELQNRATLTKLYYEGQKTGKSYITIGFHRSSKFWGTNFTRQTLKEALYRLSESATNVGVISRVLTSLGYREEIIFKFKSLPQLDALKKHSDPRTAALDLLSAAVNRARTHTFHSSLVDELRKNGVEGLAELTEEAINILAEYEEGNSLYQYRVQFGYGRRFTDFSVIQSIVLLERMRLLRLDSCILTRKEGDAMDATNASSGQQQMLCSIIGLATALRDDSLVLIDEPELSLHPLWQQQFLEYLRAALEPFKDCHVFIATHSPLIVQRARGLGSDIVALGRRELTAPKSQADDSVEETLMEVFETPVANSSHLANKVFSIISRVEEEASERGDQKPLKIEAEAELEALRRLYRSAPVNDEKSLALLDDALELVRINPYGDQA